MVGWAIAQANGHGDCSRAIIGLTRGSNCGSRHAGGAGHSRCIQVDHGYNRPATYVHAEQVKKLLKLNIKAFVPKITATHYDTTFGGIPDPTPENEARVKAFGAAMKLELSSAA